MPAVFVMAALLAGEDLKLPQMAKRLVEMGMTPTTLQELLDAEAIKQLKARYVRLMDARRWTEWRTLFTEDARFDSPSSLGSTVDLDAFVDRVRNSSIVRGSMHLACLPEIDFTGPDSATGVWRMVSVHPPQDFSDRWRAAVPDDVPYVDEYLQLFEELFSRRRVVYHGYGYYVDQYRRVSDGWRISSIQQAHMRRDAIPATVLRMVETDAS
jgi:SnoaL-like domain